MSDISLKNFSLAQIEASVAKALTDLTGQSVKVSINGIEHPPGSPLDVWSSSSNWQANFTVLASHEVPEDFI